MDGHDILPEPTRSVGATIDLVGRVAMPHDKPTMVKTFNCNRRQFI
jgi:hypothetical protein